jgi:hypothetical protein
MTGIYIHEIDFILNNSKFFPIVFFYVSTILKISGNMKASMEKANSESRAVRLGGKKEKSFACLPGKRRGKK